MKRQPSNKRILFIEPIKQGFGDLLFQTPLFRSWHKNGYSVNILLAKKEHEAIIKNSTCVDKVFRWSVADLLEILFTSYGSIVSLCRNSIRENFLLIAKVSSNKNLLDFDPVLWEKVFSDNPNTIAWQVIINKINPDLDSHGVPQIFFSDLGKGYISENKKGQIVIIVGIENKLKQASIEKILSQIPSGLLRRVILVGKSKINICKPYIKNLINKLTYRKTILEIASASFVFGPEGSLVHVASVLGVETAIWDPKKLFTKNAHSSLLGDKNLLFIYSEKELQKVTDCTILLSAEN